MSAFGKAWGTAFGNSFGLLLPLDIEAPQIPGDGGYYRKRGGRKRSVKQDPYLLEFQRKAQQRSAAATLLQPPQPSIQDATLAHYAAANQALHTLVAVAQAARLATVATCASAHKPAPGRVRVRTRREREMALLH